MSAHAALGRLAKWRTVFAGWQLGTRSMTDPECQAVRDHREATLILRAETTALVGLLIEKGAVTAAEYDAAVANEADQLSADLSKRFRGMKATDDGIVLDVAVIQEHGTIAGWEA